MKRTAPLLAVLLLHCGLPDQSPNRAVARNAITDPQTGEQLPYPPFDSPPTLPPETLEPVPGWQELPRSDCPNTFVFDSEQPQTYQGVDCLVVIPRRTPRKLSWVVDYPVFNEAACVIADRTNLRSDGLTRLSRPQWINGRCVVTSKHEPRYQIRNAIELTGVNLGRYSLTVESR